MRSTTKIFFILINFIFLIHFFNSYYLAQIKEKSIIKLFCLSNFKEEMLKSDIVYSEEIANKTCECYLEEFEKTSSHQKAVIKCKLEAQEKFNL